MLEIRCGLSAIPEGYSEKRVSFKGLKKLKDEDIEVGMRITSLKPSKLYVSQSWTDVEKLSDALNIFSRLRETTTLVIPVYVYNQQLKGGKNHRILVVGDCHHRTLIWDMNGLPIDGEVIDTSLPEDLKRDIIPFSQFRRLHVSRALTF